MINLDYRKKAEIRDIQSDTMRSILNFLLLIKNDEANNLNENQMLGFEYACQIVATCDNGDLDRFRKYK